MCNNCMKKKKILPEIVEEKQIITNEIVNRQEREDICEVCEFKTPKTHICTELDCKDCKTNVFQYLVTISNKCPKNKWIKSENISEPLSED